MARTHHHIVQPGASHLSTFQLLACSILRGLTDHSVSLPRSLSHSHVLARSADALQFLRLHALQPAHDDSMTEERACGERG
jgi:hypothetical protein